MIYKIVAKVLTNTLKIVFAHIISNNQATFLKDRSITVMAMIGNDILDHIYRISSQELALKLSMLKLLIG